MKTLKLILKSLISNASCVEGGRKKPWYFAIIMFLFSMIIAIVPITIQTANKNGSDFISGTHSYNFDVYSLAFANEINDLGIEMAVKSDESGNYLDVDTKRWNESFAVNSDPTDAHSFARYIHQNNEGNVDFEVYYYDSDRIASEYLNSVLNTVPSARDEATNTVTAWAARSCSFIIFARRQVVSYVYATGNVTSKGSSNGDYASFEAGVYRVNEIGVVYFEGDPVGYTMHTVAQQAYGAYHAQVFANWKNFFNKAYYNNKMNAIWQTTLLMLGIDVVLTLFMGLMIFILTRGKNNPFRIYTFWETQKIAYWCTVSPAIIAMILSFIISGFAQIMFALLIGVRVMWLSMKTLRPENAVVGGTPNQGSSNKGNVQTVNSKPSKK